jgi:hypothetical protein
MGYYDEDGLLPPYWDTTLMPQPSLLIPRFRPLPLVPPRHAQACRQDCPSPRP